MHGREAHMLGGQDEPERASDEEEIESAGAKDEDPRMKVYQTRAEPALDGSYRVVTMRTTRGDVMCRYYRAPNARRAAIWVVGVGGGFVSPAGDFYPRLCTE